MTKIAVLVGSLREASLNKKLAQAIEERLPEGTEVLPISVDLPLYNEDIERAGVPAAVQAAKDAVVAADGLIIITPEYNRSIPGVLKNAIDWISRPYGDNSFAGKPVVIAGASPSPLATTQSQFQLRSVVSFLGMQLFAQPELYVDATRFFDENGAVTPESAPLLQQFVDAAVQRIVAHSQKG